MISIIKAHPFKAMTAIYYFVIAAFLYFGVVFFYPFKVIEFTSPIEFQDPVYAGEMAFYHMKYNKHMQIPATVTRQIVDGNIIYYPDVQSDLLVGNKEAWGNIEIPNYIKPGEYRLVMSSEYILKFPFAERKIVIREESKPFKVYFKSRIVGICERQEAK